jgi:hypothetical protein
MKFRFVFQGDQRCGILNCENELQVDWKAVEHGHGHGICAIFTTVIQVMFEWTGKKINTAYSRVGFPDKSVGT